MEQSQKNQILVNGVASRMGWRIVFQNEDGIQYEKGYEYNSAYFVLGGLLAIVGIGIVLLAFGFAEMLLRGKRLLYIPTVTFASEDADAIIQKFAPIQKRKNKTNK